MIDEKTPLVIAVPDKHLLDQLATAVVCLDGNLHINFLNHAAESLFSLSARKAAGEHCGELVGLPDSLIERFKQTLETGHAYNDRQVPLTPKGKDPLLIDCLISPSRASDTTTELLIEVTPVDRQMKIAREEALISQQEHSRSLLRGLAHEIRNPLGGLRGAAQLLDRELNDDELKDYTSVIIREADRLQQLIDRMLGPGSKPDMELLNIHETLEHVRKIIRAEGISNISLVTDYDPSIPEFKSDWDRLTQVFLNIAVNALAAVGESGKITFRSRVENNFTIGTVRHRLVIAAQIADTGPGIDPDMLEQIFYPMVTGREGGTGLGLSIAQQTINQLGGLVECNSKPGDTVFTVYIPMEQT